MSKMNSPTESPLRAVVYDTNNLLLNITMHTMRNTNTTKTAIAIVSAFGLGSSAYAAELVGVTSISYTGTAGEEAALSLNNENQIIDGSGLIDLTGGALTVDDVINDFVSHENVADGNAWATIDPAPGGGDFFADSVDTVVFELILDNTYTITDFAHWGYGFGTINDNNIAELTFDYGVGDFASTTGSVAIAETAVTGGSLVTSLGSITADRIRITATDNHFVPVGGDGGDRVGIAEIRFIGDVASVPEPSSAALLGLGGLSLLLRRRK